MGTRFLPATKAVPKELLPVIDTPLIDFAIEEARAAGIERMIFVSHPSKDAIERHVMDDARLRAQLKAKGKDDVAADLAEAALDERSDDVIFTFQDKPLGLGHAVGCAREHVLPGPVAVILPDDLILGGKGCLSEMIAAYDANKIGHLVATMQVPIEDTASYGILSVTEQKGALFLADAMVEKPDPADAPSRQAVVGRYILDASIFDALDIQQPGAGGEIQLTDAIARGASTIGLGGFQFSGMRFDCGSKKGMLSAVMYLARQRPEFDSVFEEIAEFESFSSAA
jgi:UTP-glucose-1-phosphate uridylyltransferase